jgi:hypothetical protein
LPEPFGWGGFGQVRESDRRAESNADADHGGEQSGDARDEYRCRACGSRDQAGGQGGKVADAAVVSGTPGAMAVSGRGREGPGKGLASLGTCRHRQNGHRRKPATSRPMPQGTDSR